MKESEVWRRFMRTEKIPGVRRTFKVTRVDAVDHYLMETNLIFNTAVQALLI